MEKLQIAPPAVSAPPEETYLPEAKPARRGIGLCLSGGGYRAVLFHLGALRRLKELGILSHPDLLTISSVSGGSLAAAHLATVMTRHRDWQENWERLVEIPLRALAARNIRTGPILQRFLPWKWFRESTAVEALAKKFERHLTDLSLRDLPEKPRFVFCATDMAFGVNWEFARDRMGDYQVGYMRPVPAEWPLARAVAASACFPPIFNPLPVPRELGEYRSGKALERDPDSWRKAVQDLRLTDGGNYDNMGLEPIWKSHAVVLVSDAGGPFNAESDTGLIWRVGRYQAIQENQARALRKRWLISNFMAGILEGTYWGIGGSRTSYLRTDTLGYSNRFSKKYIAEIRTDFDAFSDMEAAILENHGYLLADVAVQKHLGSSLVRQPAAPCRPPHAEWLPPARTEEAMSVLLERSAKRKILGRR